MPKNVVFRVYSQNLLLQVTAAPTPTNGGDADLTFNLSLSDREKQARSQLVLPYTIEANQFVFA